MEGERKCLCPKVRNEEIPLKPKYRMKIWTMSGVPLIRNTYAFEIYSNTLILEIVKRAKNNPNIIPIKMETTVIFNVNRGASMNRFLLVISVCKKCEKLGKITTSFLSNNQSIILVFL
jgi:hypothetical protein